MFLLFPSFRRDSCNVSTVQFFRPLPRNLCEWPSQNFGDAVYPWMVTPRTFTILRLTREPLMIRSFTRMTEFFWLSAHVQQQPTHPRQSSEDSQQQRLQEQNFEMITKLSTITILHIMNMKVIKQPLLWWWESKCKSIRWHVTHYYGNCICSNQRKRAFTS